MDELIVWENLYLWKPFFLIPPSFFNMNMISLYGKKECPILSAKCPGSMRESCASPIFSLLLCCLRLCNQFSGHVQEIRTLVTQRLDLRLVLAFDPVIPLSGPPLFILGLERKVRRQTAEEEEQRHVRQHDAVAEVVFRLVFCAVDVAAYDACFSLISLGCFFFSEELGVGNSPFRFPQPVEVRE